MDYRNERDALRGRVEHLEQELEQARRDLRARRAPFWRAVLVVIAVLGAMAIGLAALTLARSPVRRPSVPSATPVATVVTASAVEAPRAAPVASPRAPVTIEVTIGGKGDGPGLFDDPREVAPERDGSFWVADYASGRVQRFDHDGKFVSLIKIEPGPDGRAVLDMAAGEGRLFVVRAGELLRFSIADGKKLGAVLPPRPGAQYRHVFVDAAGDLYALSVEKDEKLGAISKFDRDGKLVGRWPRKASEQEYYLNHDRIAVDGAGTMFVAHHFGYFVEVLDPKGALVNRIGQEGRGSGEFERLGMGSIDVDGRRHVLVANGDAISVFDAGGRFRGDLHVPRSVGYVRSFRIGRDGRLYGATNQDRAFVCRLDAEAIDALGR